MLSAVVVLVLGGGIVLIEARRLSKSLHRITDAIGTFDAKDLAAIPQTRIAELDDLVRALRRRRDTVERNVALLTQDRVQAVV